MSLLFTTSSPGTRAVTRNTISKKAPAMKNEDRMPNRCARTPPIKGPLTVPTSCDDWMKPKDEPNLSDGEKEDTRDKIDGR